MTVANYTGPLTPKQKEELLLAYCDYVSYIALLTDFVQAQKITNLAAYELRNVYSGIGNNPWCLEDLEAGYKKAYHDFVTHNNNLEDDNLCFVSAIYTEPNSNQDEINKILASPQNYTRHVHSNQLPCRVERYVACCPKGTLLKDAKFIINGKYQVFFDGAQDDMTVGEMFDNEQLEKQFSCLMETIAQFPDNIYKMTDKESRDKQIEVMASSLTAPIEEVLLATLSTLAETGQNAIKELVRNRGEDFLYKAEQKGLIPSASHYQDYLNIRNLAHHQLGTLDYLSCFNDDETEKNDTLRKRYMESYLHLCGGMLSERISNYQATVSDFHQLISELAPNIFIRGDKESNSKFINRIREYKHAHPDEKLYVETNFLGNKSKKDSLIKQIHKVVPNVQIIDETAPDPDAFIKRMEGFTFRKKYLELFEHIEYALVRHFLFRGENYIPKVAWQQAHHQKILTTEEAQKWNELKKLRNDLSHKFYTKELEEQVMASTEVLFEHALRLDTKIRQLQPNVYLAGPNTYEFVHRDGIVAVIDFDNKKILSLTDAKGRSLLEKKEKRKISHKPFVEEYKQGISFYVKGADILNMRTPNGCKVDIRAESIFKEDGAKIYFKSKPHKYLMFGDVKITFDDKLRIDNFVRDNKSETVGKNEIITLKGSHRITTGKNKELTQYLWNDKEGKPQSISFSTNNKGEIIAKSSDGTIVKISEKGLTIHSKGIELSYQNRAQFVASYDDNGIPPNGGSGFSR